MLPLLFLLFRLIGSLPGLCFRIPGVVAIASQRWANYRRSDVCWQWNRIVTPSRAVPRPSTESAFVDLTSAFRRPPDNHYSRSALWATFSLSDFAISGCEETAGRS